jgi:hypothetical protein
MQGAGVRHTTVSSRVENGVELLGAPKEGRELLGVLPERGLGLYKFDALGISLECLYRPGVQGSMPAFRGSDRELDMWCENVVWMGKFWLLIVRTRRYKEIGGKLILTKYQPVGLPVEPNRSWEERTMRTFLVAILMDIKVFFLVMLSSFDPVFVDVGLFAINLKRMVRKEKSRSSTT